MPPRLVETPSRLHLYQCLHRTNSPRFSTSTAAKAQLSPESPKFIEIPRPVQPQQIYRPFVKGVLPVPRQLFPRKTKSGVTDKAAPDYLANITPEPIEDKTRPRKIEDPKTAEFVSWKARQAEARRRNLRESLIELQQRKRQMDGVVAARSLRKQAERTRVLSAPEREDERLTNPSVLTSETPTKHHLLPDPNRTARLARKRENVARIEAMRQENRRNALHTLYINAGSFITTGAQLDRVIDQAFDDESQFSTDQRHGENIWNLGFPETVQELLRKANKAPGSQKAMDSAEGNAGVTRERMRRIGEELTGGKMEEIR
ncbi:hypothetical protein MMC28_005779 [Mycoblastus sanguinarius]|nr:hypothetical protein [Mycoblastus sanguinarius]